MKLINTQFSSDFSYFCPQSKFRNIIFELIKLFYFLKVRDETLHPYIGGKNYVNSAS